MGGFWILDHVGGNSWGRIPYSKLQLLDLQSYAGT